MSLDAEAITGKVKLGKADNYKVNEEYPWNGVHSVAKSHCNGSKISISSGTLHYTLDVRVFNDGAAFRLIVPGKPTAKRIADESTVFRLPSGTTAWYHDLYMHYEGEYAGKSMDTVKAGQWAALRLRSGYPTARFIFRLPKQTLRLRRNGLANRWQPGNGAAATSKPAHFLSIQIAVQRAKSDAPSCPASCH